MSPSPPFPGPLPNMPRWVLGALQRADLCRAMQQSAQGRIWWPQRHGTGRRQGNASSDVRHPCLECRSVAQSSWLLIVKEEPGKIRGSGAPGFRIKVTKMLEGTGDYCLLIQIPPQILNELQSSRLLQEALAIRYIVNRFVVADLLPCGFAAFLLEYHTLVYITVIIYTKYTL